MLKKILVATVAVAGLLAAPIAPVTAHPEGPECGGWHATIVGSKRAEVLKGTPGRDVIVARGGADRIDAGPGNDIVCAGAGADVVLAGDGNDVVYGQGGADEASGGAGTDDLAGGKDADRLSGDDGDDALFGGAGPDELSGGPGIELLVGGAEDDMLDAGTDGAGTVSFAYSRQAVTVDLAAGSATGEGIDTLIGLVANVIGSAFDDVLSGNAERNRLEGRDGNDTLTGGDLADSFLGGPGDDSLDGGPGADSTIHIESPNPVEVDLGAGTSTRDGADTLTAIEDVVGSNQGDVLRGDGSGNSLAGAAGDDTIHGLGGNDTLTGGRDDDVLFGDDGDDQLYGGEGESDTGDGGAGADTCWADDANSNCEQQLINGSTAFTVILEPTSGARIGSESFSRIAGRSSFGHWGPDVEEVQLALRLETPHGCRWWSDRRGQLLARPCYLSGGGWFKPGGDPAGNWSYRFFSQLPAGRYELRSTAVNKSEGPAGSSGSYREQFSEAGRNLIAFTLI